jgi:hypothetical protein
MTLPNDKQTPSTQSSSQSSTSGGAKPYPFDATQIKTGMPIVCSEDGALGIVDRMEGKSSIKLNKDKAGVHHYIPLGWVSRVDAKVHLDRPGAQAMREWKTAAPIGA